MRLKERARYHLWVDQVSDGRVEWDADETEEAELRLCEVGVRLPVAQGRDWNAELALLIPKLVQLLRDA